MSSLSLTTTERLKALLPQLFSEQQRQGDYYLRFQLTNGVSALIDLKYVQESLTVDGDQITAIPNLPEYVLGLMSSRNQVFLALDLAHLMGLTPETVNLRQYQTVIVQIQSDQHNESSNSNEENLFGLTVKSIEGISRIQSEQFCLDIESLPESLSPFVQKSVISESIDKNQTAEILEPAYLIDISKVIQHKI